jgi:hypothetical protein
MRPLLDFVKNPVWRGRPRPRKESAKATLEGKPSPFRSLLFLPLILVALLSILSLSSLAQRQSPPTLRNFGQHGFARRTVARRTPHSPLGAFPFPFLGESFNPDDIPSAPDSTAAQSPAFLMQALQSLTGAGASPLGPAMGAPNRQPSSSEPLMIELQNGRYVRVKGNAVDGEAQPLPPLITKNTQAAKPARDHSVKSATQPSNAPLIALAPLPAAVLVFRDGHREEVRDYTIANGTLYASGDYYTDGYWNKKIDLASLNIPGTLEANATRNVKFTLPASPNEVITRF